ncbi:uncharacterized protein LOC110907434 [Helianthus annuus]|uniref:uncharacterized protein LOC110907434 n=1 Tax=Helianthus annuus TaxID=4232 RepID=UPI000B902DBF|nr:uncharacterized protein LOC110907434 [Helianthus annuus]
MADEDGWYIRETAMLDSDVVRFYDGFPHLFTLRLHHGGRLTQPPGRMYVGGKIDHVDLIDIDKFSVHEVDLMLDILGYNGRVEPMCYMFLHPKKNLDQGLEHLSCDKDCLNLGTHVEEHKIINVYISHGLKNIKDIFSPVEVKPPVTIEEIDEPGPFSIVPFKLNFDACLDDLEVGQGSGSRQEVNNDTAGLEVGQGSGSRQEVNNDTACLDDLELRDQDDNEDNVENDDNEVDQDNEVDGSSENDDNEVDQDDEVDGLSENDHASDDDSDYIVDEANNIKDHEVDMPDYSSRG